MSLTRYFLIILFLGCLFYTPGLGLDSAITSKDEYLLSLRTPIEMIEEGQFLTPYLDHEPRLKKPPLLYWLIFLSYKSLGINLFSARIWGVLSAIGLAAATMGIHKRIGAAQKRELLTSAIVALSCAGIAVQARVALLDLPLAFLVTLSILFFLMWKESERTIHLLLSAAVCGLSVLLKGPVGPMIVTMAVVLNVLLLGGGATFRRRWKESILAVVLFLAIAGSWTGAMYLIWSDLFIQEVYNELIKARFLTSYSTGPEAVLGGILLLLLPWSFLYLRSLASTLGRGLHHENRSALWLLAWSLASLVPFLLLKVKFERYLLVAVPPAVLLLCTVPYRSSLWQKLAFRSTAVLYGLVGLGLIAFGFWFRVSPLWVMALLLILLGLFCFRAWKARDLAATALTAGLFHMVLFGLFYPGIGIQAIPPDLLSEIRRNAAPVYYYRGDNPGLLSIKLRKSIQKVKGPAELKQLSESGVKIIVEEKYEKEFSEVLTKAGLPASQPALRFTSFYSRVGWINFPREGTTVEDWKRAFDERSLEGLKTGFALYYVKRGKV